MGFLWVTLAVPKLSKYIRQTLNTPKSNGLSLQSVGIEGVHYQAWKQHDFTAMNSPFFLSKTPTRVQGLNYSILCK